MPALRRKSGTGHHRALDPIQGYGLVRHRLRPENIRRRCLEPGEERKVREIRKVRKTRVQAGVPRERRKEIHIQIKRKIIRQWHTLQPVRFWFLSFRNSTQTEKFAE